MTPQPQQQTYQRGTAASTAGLVLQLALVILAALTGLWSKAPALNMATWYFVGGLPIWVILWMIYRQQEMLRLETLEAAQLTGSPSGTSDSALFGDAQQGVLRTRQQLENLIKWGLPIVAAILAIDLLTLGGIFFYTNYQAMGRPTFVSDALGDQASPLVLMGLSAIAAFGSFIFARYLSGMTQTHAWQLLRGGAGYLMGNALVALLVLVAAVFSYFRNDQPIAWLRLVVPAIMLLTGLEIAVSLLLGAYRPRKPGEIGRPAFDSRILGWLTKPESLAKAINETINYQFGFEISRSWFYQLLSRSIVPMILFGLLVLLGISSLAIIDPMEQGVITTFGRISQIPAQPGLHVKWAWPVGRVERYPVGRLQQLIVGSYTQRPNPTKAILWTNQHTEGKEELMIVAAKPAERVQKKSILDSDGPASEASNQRKSPDVALVAAQIDLQYQVTDLQKYVTSSSDPKAMLTILADRAINAYFATHELGELISQGRESANRTLRQAIQQEADDAGLGVMIAFVGVTGIHPPQTSEVAAAFHQQVGAIQQREITIQKANQQAIQTLSEVAGSVEMAQQISQSIAKLEALRRQADADKNPALAKELAQQELEVERLLWQAPGKAGQLIHEARAYRWNAANAERAKAARFQAELAASNAAPKYYQAKTYFDMLAETLAGPRKYILCSQTRIDGAPAATANIYRLDLKDTGSNLDSFLKPQ